MEETRKCRHISHCYPITNNSCRLLRDAQLFDTRLGKIDGFGDIGRILVDQVKAKTVDAPVSAPTPAVAAAPEPDPAPSPAPAPAPPPDTASGSSPAEPEKTEQAAKETVTEE